MQGRLLTISGVLECLTGLAFLLSPGGTIAFLLGAEPGSVGLMIGRVAGVALLSLGIACWGARKDAGGAARMGTLRAITLYNAGAGLLLVSSPRRARLADRWSGPSAFFTGFRRGVRAF